MKQLTVLIATRFFSLKAPGARGKSAFVIPGDRFLVTSPTYANKETAKIMREKLARLNQGYLLSLTDIETCFEKEIK